MQDNYIKLCDDFDSLVLQMDNIQDPLDINKTKLEALSILDAKQKMINNFFNF